MKRFNQHTWLIVAIMIAICFSRCSPKVEEEANSISVINTAHLDALYAEKMVGEDTVGMIHIYAEYPDYHLVGDSDEGIACVDDASRASIFYLRHYQNTSDAEHLRKGRMLIKFLLAMQSPNGYYYNFIWPDGTIHTDGITSKPEPAFWSWRTLWAFGEAIHILDQSDPLVNQMKKQREILVGNILKEEAFRSNATYTTMGWSFPTWLPKISGTDQASIVLIGLSFMHQQMNSIGIQKDSLAAFMEHFADGITLMQIEQPDSLHDGAFLSWENLWHAYANVQSYALLTAGQVLNDPHMTAHALYEIDHFYPAFLKAGGLEHFFVRVEDGKILRYDTKSFSQIAYGRRPMIWSSLKAYELTKDEKYLSLAKDLAAWFSGANPANTPMYDPSTGRGYDGISSPDQINKNSGAESTIESLLSLLAMEEYIDK